ncbi:MAG: biopolymer transporter ExbD [Arsenophonus sp. ET-KM2-MAG3]
MSRIRRRYKLKSEINIVPLLDILLVLLLIFILTTPIIPKSLKIELPSIKKPKNWLDSNNSYVVLEVSGIEQYNVILDGHRENFLSRREIEVIAKNALAKNSQVNFLIGAAKDVPYEEIIKALNIFNQIGIKSVGFMVQPI